MLCKSEGPKSPQIAPELTGSVAGCPAPVCLQHSQDARLWDWSCPPLTPLLFFWPQEPVQSLWYCNHNHCLICLAFSSKHHACYTVILSPGFTESPDCPGSTSAACQGWPAAAFEYTWLMFFKGWLPSHTPVWGQGDTNHRRRQWTKSSALSHWADKCTPSAPTWSLWPADAKIK